MRKCQCCQLEAHRPLWAFVQGAWRVAVVVTLCDRMLFWHDARGVPHEVCPTYRGGVGCAGAGGYAAERAIHGRTSAGRARSGQRADRSSLCLGTDCAAPQHTAMDSITEKSYHGVGFLSPLRAHAPHPAALRKHGQAPLDALPLANAVHPLAHRRVGRRVGHAHGECRGNPRPPREVGHG